MQQMYQSESELTGGVPIHAFWFGLQDREDAEPPRAVGKWAFVVQ